VAAVAAAAMLAFVVIDRLDSQTIAVLVGASCGALAGVPLTAVAFWVQRRRQSEPRESMPQWRERPPPPQIIVVQPPPAQAPPPVPGPGWQNYAQPSALRQPRRFNIIGEEEEDDGNP
jgi:hypothetical protein